MHQAPVQDRRGDLNPLILRLRGRDDRNNTDSSARIAAAKYLVIFVPQY